MTILSGDVKLVASEVMDDVPEGGGAPTANLIVDGNSNSIFNDISELDRAGGRVSLRKTFLSVQTPTVDTYFGGNVIVAEPPADPRVAVTLFTTESFFDTRDQAAVRIESYLNTGPEWGGFLLENHIAGQRVIQLGQRVNSELPNVGQTLVLIQNEGLSTQKIQYVRTTAVSRVERTFFDGVNDYQAWVVSLSISDALRYDFAGSAMSRSFARTGTNSKVRDTVVADAGTYVGAAPLALAADLGDFTVTAETIYTQLVPSAQTETPILDIRMNGLSAALVSTGAAVTQTISMGFTTTTNMHVGGPILPASLSIVRSGVTLTDSGGILMNAGAEVGQVDYDNGIVSLSTNVWGSGTGTHTVTFTPAAIPDLISQQRSIPVTVESRALNYVFVMEEIPLPRTMSVSYLAQGRWYVLRDNGAGVLKGTDSAYGVGTVSYTTGGVSVTLGALPDVGSAVVVQSYGAVNTVGASNAMLHNSGKLYMPFNTSGVLSEEPGTKTISPNALTITWNDGTARTATDDGAGALVGDATGTVDYARGVVRFSPNLLPAPNAAISASLDSATVQSATGVTLASGSLGATGITPGTVAFTANLLITYGFASAAYRVGFDSRLVSVQVKDDGAGNLTFVDPGTNATVSCGTINYAAGTIARTAPTLSKFDISGPGLTYFGAGWGQWTTAWSSMVSINSANCSRTASWPDANGNVTFDNVAPASQSINVTFDQLVLRTLTVPNYTLKGVGFKIGSTPYGELTDETLVRDVSALTGGGTPAGAVTGATGAVSVASWPTGASPTVTEWRGVLAPPSIGAEAPFTAFSTTFRTASSPLRPASVSVMGTMQDGTTFNVTATTEGKINGTRVKGKVDYQYGLVELWFVNPSGPSELNVDLTHLGIAGLTTIPADLVMLGTLRYNAVAYTYLPLDADILGIDPVRLPSDGRVPIFRPGGFVVVGHTGTVAPVTVSNSQTVDCGRVRLSRVRVLGNDGNVINTGYTFDLELGTVTFTNVTGYSQPVTVEHRIEDMAVVSGVQISGELTFTRPLTHDYPLGSYASSALIAGDLHARQSIRFDQGTWANVWQDTVSGSAATGTYNAVAYPFVVTNEGALTERWALVFTNSTTFNIVGESVGVIGVGNINTETAPLNPATGSPYFTIHELGWGIGWATGNVLRFNTIGALFPVWIVRTVQQGPETVTNDSFTVLLRGDVDNPI